ncbi:MAG: alpha/beta fold hydrolase [Xanthomonadaceae bacterium]|nr:alpha/beta fold hydrolase [Xanthomonadaceae bacterium]
MYAKPVFLTISFILAICSLALAAAGGPSSEPYKNEAEPRQTGEPAAGRATLTPESTLTQPQTTLVGGHRISYLDQGEGPVVLLLHGIPTNNLMWRKVVPALSDRFRVIAPDLLNFGQSARPEIADVSINAQRRMVFGLMDSLGIGRAHLVAHDIGGGVAQLMAVEHPERIDRLILIDAVSFDSWPVPEFEPLQQPGAEGQMQLEQFVGMIRSFMPQGVVDQSVMTESVIDLYANPWSSEAGKRAFFRNLRRQFLSDE